MFWIPIEKSLIITKNLETLNMNEKRQSTDANIEMTQMLEFI